MKRFEFKFTLLFCLFCSAALVNAQNFSKGAELFGQNNPSESIPYLEKAMSAREDSKVYEYLSLAYFQTGQYQKGLDVSQKGMNVSGTDKKILALNAGNAAFIMLDFAEADKWYTLAITANPDYSAPVLNRANARVYEGKLAEAKADYRKYLELEPNDSRRPEIELILKELDNEIARQKAEEEAQKAEQERIAKEEQRIQEAIRAEEERKEAERKAEEARLAKEEAERRQKLLDEVAASLQEAETTNITAGAGDIIDYGYENELE